MPYFRLRASEGKWEYQPFNRPDFLWRSGVQQPAPNAFDGKLALLVDAGCHSACEDFVMPFKDNGRAVLVGESTAGNTGQPYVFDLGHDMILMVGAKREMFPDGSRFEGVGIKPDLVISPSPDDIRPDTDVVLQAARRRLAGS
jgi:carboxyl-terminal processing protease